MEYNLNTIINPITDYLSNIQSFDSRLGEYFGVILVGISLMWVGIIITVAINITKRTSNMGFQIICIILATILGPIGGLVYLIIRPIKKKESKQEIYDPYVLECFHCSLPNHLNSDYCIYCGKGLKTICKECGKNIPCIHPYCSHCGAPNLSS